MPFEMVKEQMVRSRSPSLSPSLLAHLLIQKTGTAPPSFTKLLLDEAHANGTLTPSREHTIKWAAASLYSGGADTTVSSISTFFLSSLLFPSVQKRAQEELDRVIGPDRLPSFADRDKLPYIDAMVKEVLRWGPVGPLAVPHRSTGEDVYDGKWRLPKGGLIFANIWYVMFGGEVVLFSNLYQIKGE